MADSDLASQSYDDVDSSLPSEDDEEIDEEQVAQRAEGEER